MGNFVSSSYSTSSPPTTTPPASLPPLPSPSHHKDRTTLTSALTSHATQLAHLLSSIVSDRIHLDDIEEGSTLPRTRGPHADADVLDGRRRALLIGIAYHGELTNTHEDVDRYRDVLLDAHGYRAEDVVVLKDDPALPAHLQPTRENILRELRHLVADAAPGDRFTFLYFGHSNQQRSKGLNEEDFKDEYLITIDDEIVVDNELNDILVNPLPAGCSLLALLDTCDSGTHQLDLSHYHCNSTYVPWRSNGKRRTQSWQNVTVRRTAAFMQDPVSSQEAAASTMWTAIAALFAWRIPSAPPKVRSVLPIFGHQRTWEAYHSSLTGIMCSACGAGPYPATASSEQNRLPSYKELMMHINYGLYAWSRELHEWTRSEKKAAATVRAYDGQKFQTTWQFLVFLNVQPPFFFFASNVFDKPRRQRQMPLFPRRSTGFSLAGCRFVPHHAIAIAIAYRRPQFHRFLFRHRAHERMFFFSHVNTVARFRAFVLLVLFLT